MFFVNYKLFINILKDLYWDTSEGAIQVGCHVSGFVLYSFDATSDTYLFSLHNCEFFSGFVVTGNGTEIGEAFELRVDVTGVGVGQLKYERDQDGNIKVTGDWVLPEKVIAYIVSIGCGLVFSMAAGFVVLTSLHSRYTRRHPVLIPQYDDVELESTPYRARSPAKQHTHHIN